MDANKLKSQLNNKQFYMDMLPSLVYKGKNQVLTHCVFHFPDRNPSLSLNLENGLFNCFACGKQGNAFQFYMEYENVNFPDAINEIAEMQGIY